MNKLKRVSALIAVILWVLMLLVTLVVAFIDTPECNALFRGLMITDIIFPIVIYAMMLVYRILVKRNK